MDIGIVKIAEDKDFEKLKQLYDDNNEWRLDYNKPDLSVWTKSVRGISFRMVKVCFFFSIWNMMLQTFWIQTKWFNVVD